MRKHRKRANNQTKKRILDEAATSTSFRTQAQASTTLQQKVFRQAGLPVYHLTSPIVGAIQVEAEEAEER